MGVFNGFLKGILKGILFFYKIDYKKTIYFTKQLTGQTMNQLKQNTPTLTNKGNGAGGTNTNYYGKLFEEKTNNQQNLLDDGFVKTSFAKNTKKYYLSKKYDDKTVVFVLQNGLKQYMKYKYNINLFRCPDESYIVEYNDGRKMIKILEKKEQHVNGSVETKLWSGPSLKREYELALGGDFQVFYGFCVNGFLQTKILSNEHKYILLNVILRENNIDVLFGDNDDYFMLLNEWINSSL
jgi:hypothetical protein